MKKVIIYGGAFNPPTISHLETAKIVLKKTKYDELWFMPCYDHAFKNEFAPASNRIEMLGLLLKDGDRGKLWVNTHEIDNEGKYAIDTIKQLKEKYPNVHFAWLIGVDNAKIFHKWKHYANILDNIQIIIVDRYGSNMDGVNWLLKSGAIHVKTPNKYPFNVLISSTQVRNQALERDKDIMTWRCAGKFFTQNEILSYIEENSLYLNKKKK